MPRNCGARSPQSPNSLNRQSDCTGSAIGEHANWVRKPRPSARPASNSQSCIWPSRCLTLRKLGTLTMRLSQPVDYALRAMRYLATLPEDEEATRSTLSAHLEAPEPFLAKVMRRLAVADLVESQRGVGGGFRLARPPERITMLQVVEAVEGSAGLNSCFLRSEPCDCGAPCGAHTAFAGVRAAMRHALETTSIADLCREKARKK